MNNIRGGCWPSQNQELLLRAALLQGDKALCAWQEWKSKVDIDLLNAGSLRLLPLLYRNLSSLGVGDPVMDIYKGVYRLTWYKNQMLFHSIASVIRCLEKAGIRTMILKGAAMTLMQYKDLGLCPMSDFDMLVPSRRAPSVFDLLVETGWSPQRLGQRGRLTEEFMKVRHSIGFKDNKGREFDLHWHLLHQCCRYDADDDFWDGAVPVQIHGVSALALNPADQLLHICVHGAIWNNPQHLRWLADAATIVKRSGAGIDWDRLLQQAEKMRLIVPVRETLRYMCEKMDVVIPARVYDKFQGMTVSKSDEIEYCYATKRPTTLGWLILCWMRYSRTNDGTSLACRLVMFTAFLQKTWGLGHIWQTPFYAAYKVIRKIGRKAESKAIHFSDTAGK